MVHHVNQKHSDACDHDFNAKVEICLLDCIKRHQLEPEYDQYLLEQSVSIEHHLYPI